MELLFILLSLSFLILLKFLIPKNNNNPPPGPPSLPIIGHLHLLKTPPLHKTLANLSQKYGPIFRLHFGARPVLVVTSPTAVEECFTRNDIIFASRPRFMMGKIAGDNYTSMLWAPYGAHWRTLRRISAIELLSNHRVHSFSNIRLDEVKYLVKRLNTGHQVYDMKKMFFELTLNIMMRMIAGKVVCGEHIKDAEEAKHFHELIKESFYLASVSNIEDFLPVVRWFGVKSIEKRTWALKGKRDKYVQDLIQERRNLTSEEEGVEKKMTLIDVLLSLQEKEPDFYTDEMIRSFAWVMFAAGIDTSSNTMEWSLSLLLNNPDTIKKAQTEIDLQVGQSRLMNESDLDNLPYLHGIIKEALRMYPPGPLLVPHESSEECKVGGFNVARGTMLIANMWAIHRDPKLWNEPLKFKPERFDDVEGTKLGFKWLPFGSGRRGCPGEGMAVRVIGLTLGSLIQCFDWERVSPEMVDMSEGPGLNMPKLKPLKAKCRPRSSVLQFISEL